MADAPEKKNGPNGSPEKPAPAGYYEGETAPPGKRGEGDAHGVTSAVVIRELAAAGFTDVTEVPWAPPGFAVLALRPR